MLFSFFPPSPLPLGFLFPPPPLLCSNPLPSLPSSLLTESPYNAGALLDNQDVQMTSTASISAFVQLLSNEGGKAVFSEEAVAQRCRTDEQMRS